MIQTIRPQIGAKLEEKYNLYGLEVVHENYSCTIDFKREMSNPIKTQFRRMGFEVIHEESTIYTLKLDQ